MEDRKRVEPRSAAKKGGGGGGRGVQEGEPAFPCQYRRRSEVSVCVHYYGSSGSVCSWDPQRF